jgi:hypothetical protein
MNKDKRMDKHVWVSLAFLPPAAELDTNLSTQVTREDLVHFIFKLVSQNIPISNWAHFTVLLVTTWHCFIWHWTGDGFDPLLGVVVLRLSPAEVQATLLLLEGTGLGPGMLD